MADIKTILPLLLLFTDPLSAYAAPTPASIPVCTEYNCDYPVIIPIAPQAWQVIEQSFSEIESAAAEREVIRQAIARFEIMAGEQTETWRDRPGNSGDPADPGQLDCVAESLNSQRYLQLLDERGLLRWHQVMTRQSRNPWLFNFHWTAVIQEQNSGQRYAVDSWYLANGEPPHIQPLEQWQRGQSPE